MQYASHAEAPGFTAAWALAGEGIPLGAFDAGEVKIPSLGPHSYPLNDSSLFGVCKTIPDGTWSRMASLPEVWHQAEFDPQQGNIKVRCLGLRPETPVAFVFYVKAQQAKIEGERFQPKTLCHYRGEAKPVLFMGPTSGLSIASIVPTQMELIPLAGEGCFWNSQFLLAFTMPIIDGNGIFKLEKI